MMEIEYNELDDLEYRIKRAIDGASDPALWTYGGYADHEKARFKVEQVKMEVEVALMKEIRELIQVMNKSKRY